MRPGPGFAPAKINLFLHVGAVGGDGYHPLQSWMAFADVGDRLSLTDDTEMSLEVVGPFAPGLAGGGENLVIRARDLVLAEAGAKVAPFRLKLEKNLPVASGIGGGSSDAAAALRLVGEHVAVPHQTLLRIAAEIGSDVPACLFAGSLNAKGRGEVLEPAPALPPLPAVLVNPGVAVSTRAVFSAFDLGPAGDVSDVDLSLAGSTPREIAAFLERHRNDLAAPALSAAPVIGQVIDVLSAAPETLLARMSGSGATVFALCASDAEARGLAARTAAQNPLWWVKSCRLS